MERMWRVATNQIEIYSKFSLKTFFRHNVCELFNFIVSFVYYKWQLRHFTVQINHMKRIHHLRRWNDKEREKTGNYSDWIYTNWFCVHSNQPRVMFMLRNSTWFNISVVHVYFRLRKMHCVIILSDSNGSRSNELNSLVIVFSHNCYDGNKKKLLAKRFEIRNVELQCC